VYIEVNEAWEGLPCIAHGAIDWRRTKELCTEEVRKRTPLLETEGQGKNLHQRLRLVHFPLPYTKEGDEIYTLKGDLNRRAVYAKFRKEGHDVFFP
jgi:hypothetical protein